MPELPDVEVFRRRLSRGSLHRRIEGVSVKSAKILEVPARTLQRRLSGHEFASTRRHGKFLFAGLDDHAGWLVLHFGMTGFLQGFRRSEETPPHARVIFDFEDGTHLAYDDQRLFGEVDLADDPAEYASARHLGPDALDVTRAQFVELLGASRGRLKPALMDQSLLAGVGNVYADEILFQSRLHPQLKTATLDDADLRRLHGVMVRVLRGAIKAGADPKRMPKGWLLPRREEGASCPRCRGRVQRIRMGGRSSYICPACQPAPR